MYPFYPSTPMPECQNCGSHVSKEFHRVFADNAGDLWSCNECGDRQRVNVEQLRANAQ